MSRPTKEGTKFYYGLIALLLFFLAASITALLQSPAIRSTSILLPFVIILLVLLTLFVILLIQNHIQAQRTRAYKLQQQSLETDRNNLLLAVNRAYPFIILCNLEENYYEFNYLAKDRFPAHFFGPSGSYDSYFMQTLALTAAEDKDRFALKMSREALLAAFASGKDEVSMKAKQKGPDGVYHWLDFTMVQTHTADNRSFQVLLWKNIDTLMAEDALRRSIDLDGLTDIYTRKKMESIIIAKLAEQEENTLAVFAILDIDDFKQINDTYGHVYGDMILTQLAQSLKRMFYIQSAVGRLGGDEFILFTDGLKDLQQVHELGQQICSCTSLTQEIVPHTVSVGIAVAPTDGTTYPILYEKADLALYRAKRKGKNQYFLFSQ